MEFLKNKKSIIDDEEISPARLEFLTDGVFAIAMTLLVLEIKVPEFHGTVSSAEFLNSLAQVWSNLFAYILSFVILGMFWVAHHIEFRYIKRLSNGIIWINILYLMFIGMLPFYAGLLGRFYDQQLAIVLYGLHLIWLALFHFAIWHHAKHRPHLLKPNISYKLNNLVNRATLLGVLAYIFGIIVSFWSTGLTLVIYLLIPLPYIFGWVYKLED